jgi:hypothetical protein
VSADIVPFGKYKGQPVESLLADQDYMRWVVAQVGLMRMFAGPLPGDVQHHHHRGARD